MLDSDDYRGDMEVDPFGIGGDFSVGNGDTKESEILIWHKIESMGHRPAARDGHSAVANDQSVILFGGLEAGLRMNGLHVLDTPTGNWKIWDCSGELPSPRAYHAACIYNNKYMFIQGGEGSHIWIGGNSPSKTKGSSSSKDKEWGVGSISMGDSITQGSFTSKGLNIAHRTNASSSSSSSSSSSESPTAAIAAAGAAHTTTVVSPSLFVDGSDVSGEQTQILGCMDDLYVLNIETKVWTKVQSVLSPLPRRGHSIVIANLNLHKGQIGMTKDYLLLFGGLSTDRNVVGNSIHICNASEASLGRVAWRSLVCTGELPPPRHRHTCSLVHSSSNRGQIAVPDLLLVSGGLDQNNNLLADVFILNLKTLVWTKGKEGGSIEPPAVYGHVAFPALSPGNLFGSPQKEDNTPTSMIIMGGSANPGKASMDCLSKMYTYDIITESWSVVDTGFEYPAQRCGHAAAVIHGWVPEYSTPAVEGGGMKASDDLTTHDRGNSTSKGGYSRSCAMVFGGLNAQSMCKADVWILDLTWRFKGVSAFDTSLRNVVSKELGRQANDIQQGSEMLIEGESGGGGNKESIFGSIPNRNETPPGKKTTIGHESRSDQEANPNPLNDTMRRTRPEEPEVDLDEIGSAIHKVRKERMFADVQYRMERDRASCAENEVNRLTTALQERDKALEKLSKEKEIETAELRRALEVSVAESRKLEALNEEAYKLLLLQGANKEFVFTQSRNSKGI